MDGKPGAKTLPMRQHVAPRSTAQPRQVRLTSALAPRPVIANRLQNRSRTVAPMAAQQHGSATEDWPQCDCGYTGQGDTDLDCVCDAQRHAREAHSIDVSAEQIFDQRTA